MPKIDSIQNSIQAKSRIFIQKKYLFNRVQNFQYNYLFKRNEENYTIIQSKAKILLQSPPGPLYR